MVMEMETIVSIVFWLVTLIVVYRFNRDLHRDIFPKRQWKFISEVDGKEYTLEEM